MSLFVAFACAVSALILVACTDGSPEFGPRPILPISVPDAVPEALGPNAMDVLRDITGTAPGTLVVLDAASPAVRLMVLPFAEKHGIPVIAWTSPSPNVQEFEGHRLLRTDLERLDLTAIPAWAPTMDVRSAVQRDYMLRELAYLIRDATPPVAVVLPEGVWNDLREPMIAQGWTLGEVTRAPREALADYDLRTIDLAILATMLESSRGGTPEQMLAMSRVVETSEVPAHPPFQDDAARLLLAARAHRRAGDLQTPEAWLARAGELATTGQRAPDPPGHWLSTFDLPQAIEFELACLARDRGEDVRAAFDALLEDLPELEPREKVKSKGITLLQDPSFESGALAANVGTGWIQAGSSELSWPDDGLEGRCLRMTARAGQPGRIYQQVPIRWRLRTEGGAAFSVQLRAEEGRTQATLRVMYGDVASGVTVTSRIVGLTEDWTHCEVLVPVSWIHDDVILAVETEGPGVLELDAAQFWVEKPTRPILAWRDRRIARAWLTAGTAP